MSSDASDPTPSVYFILTFRSSTPDLRNVIEELRRRLGAGLALGGPESSTSATIASASPRCPADVYEAAPRSPPAPVVLAHSAAPTPSRRSAARDAATRRRQDPGGVARVLRSLVRPRVLRPVGAPSPGAGRDAGAQLPDVRDQDPVGVLAVLRPARERVADPGGVARLARPAHPELVLGHQQELQREYVYRLHVVLQDAKRLRSFTTHVPLSSFFNTRSSGKSYIVPPSPVQSATPANSTPSKKAATVKINNMRAAGAAPLVLRGRAAAHARRA